MFNFLRKKCPDKYVWSFPKLGAWFIFVVVLICVLILIPFKFGNFGFIRSIIFAIYCGFIAGLIYYLWLKLIKNNYQRPYYLIDDFFWINVILSSVAILIYIYGRLDHFGLVYVLKEETNFFSLINSFFYTYSIGIPIYLILFVFDYFTQKFVFEKMKLLNSNKNNNIEKLVKEENQSINKDKPLVDKKIKQDISLIKSNKAKPLTIHGKNNNELLEILPQNFIYAKASGNYITIKYSDTNHVIYKETIRNSITELLTYFDSYKNIIQIHRSFLVNLYYVKSIEGPIKNTKLTLEINSKLKEFSVARAKVAYVKSKFESYKKAE